VNVSLLQDFQSQSTENFTVYLLDLEVEDKVSPYMFVLVMKVLSGLLGQMANILVLGFIGVVRGRKLLIYASLMIFCKVEVAMINLLISLVRNCHD
jgi:predicted lipid-binding transport protein (Tim44 family)